MCAYPAIMDKWPVPYEELTIPTSFGETHVIARGPENALPVVLIHALLAASASWYRNVEVLSQMPPLLLACTALILYVGGWILFLSRIDGLQNEFRLFTTTQREKLVTGTRTTIPVLTTIMAFCVILVLIINGLAAKNSLNKFAPPQDVAPLAQIDLSTRDYSSEALAHFTLNGPTCVAVFVAIRNINTTYFDLSVTGPNGYSSIVLHGEGYNAFQDGGLWEENLPPGDYQIVVSSHQSPGTASVYIRTY